MFLLVLAGQEIGQSPLDVLDEGMAIAMGTFTPSAGYRTVRPLFRRITDACEAGTVPDELWVERDALELAVIGPSGAPLSANFIMIYDYDVEGERELHVQLNDVAEFERANADPRAG